VLASNLGIIKAKRSFYDRFHVMREEVEGRFVYSKGDHAWDFLFFYGKVMDFLINKYKRNK
jgi:hypothetical protein